jgi:hypothetical protein
MSQEILDLIKQETGEWPMGMEEAKELQEELEEERAERVNAVSCCEIYMIDENWGIGRPSDWKVEQGRDGYGKLSVEPPAPLSPQALGLVRGGVQNRGVRRRNRRPLRWLQRFKEGLEDSLGVLEFNMQKYGISTPFRFLRLEFA